MIGRLQRIKDLRLDRAEQQLATQQARVQLARVRQREAEQESLDYRQWRLAEEERLFAICQAEQLEAIFAISLGGCAYQPKQVEASRPLVNPVDMNAQPVMPSAVQQALNTLPQGSAFTHHDTTFTLGKRYVSALGRECVELIYSQQQGHQQRSAACKSAE